MVSGNLLPKSAFQNSTCLEVVESSNDQIRSRKEEKMAVILSLGVCQENSRVPRNRFMPKREDFAFNMNDDEFTENFRLNKILAHDLIEELRPRLEPKTCRADVISVERKVLCALRFFASGAHQKNIGNDYLLCMTQQSASNCIRQVADAMVFLMPKYINFPTSPRVQEAIKKEFFDYCGLSGVVGAIDCTHIAIVAPPDDGFHSEKNYVNRKNFHSLNVQLVCDMKMVILNIVARFPGCSHDAHIWRASKLRSSFDQKNLIHGNGWLLGDSGYPSERWLHVPFLNPSQEEELYNRLHAKGRAVIERCNGVLKNRFRCLLKYRTLHYSPEMAGKIAIACAILHNMCINDEVVWTEEDLPEEDQLFDTTENSDD